MGSDRSGQLTGFVILGLIVLVTIFFIQSYLFSWSQVKPGVVYPPEAEPVARFIEECMRQSARSGIEELGSSGGWIDVPPFIASDLSANLILDEEGLRKIPFWHHNGESRIPTIAGMERSLAAYVQRDLPVCIHNFTDLQGVIVRPLGNMSTRSIIAASDVIIETTYPLEVTVSNEKTVTIDTFQTSHDVRLKELHDLGARIMRFENEREFFENLTLDLMSASPNIPFTNMEFDCGERVWQQSAIEEEIQSIVAQNLLQIRVANTLITPFEAPQGAYDRLRMSNALLEQELNEGLEDIERSRNFPRDAPSDAYEYFHHQMDVGQAPGDVRVAFQYSPSFGMYFRANPSRDGVMRSPKLQGDSRFLPFLCVNAYHFTYDLTYPIKVSLLDPTAFGGRGFVFSFAFPVQIEHNQPTREIMRRTFQEDVQASEKFCKTVGDVFHEFRAVGIDADGFPGELSDINITYRCARRRCDLGSTAAVDGRYALITKIPSSCGNPTAIASHPDYISNETRIAQGGDGGVTLFELQHLKTLEADIVKRAFFADIGEEFRDEREMLDDELAVIRLSTKTGLDQSIVLPSNDSTIKLIDGTASYDIEIVLTRGDAIIGGYQATNLTISSDEVAQAGRITFSAVEYRPIPITKEDRVKMARFLETEKYKEQLRPELG